MGMHAGIRRKSLDIQGLLGWLDMCLEHGIGCLYVDMVQETYEMGLYQGMAYKRRQEARNKDISL